MLNGCIMKSEIPTLLLSMSLTMYLTTDSAGVNLAFLPFLLRFPRIRFQPGENVFPVSIIFSVVK